MLDIRKCSLLQLADEIHSRSIEGAVAEVGVYRGDFAKEINAAFPDRRFYLFDTFTGFTDEDIKVEEDNKLASVTSMDFSGTSVDIVRKRMPYLQNCSFKVGYFPDTVVGLDAEKFCFVSLDCDLYKPIKAGLEFFYPRLEKGGYIMVHDYYNIYNFPGVRQAINEFVSKTDASYVPIQDATGSVVISK
jgi:O-methyltransferase